MFTTALAGDNLQFQFFCLRGRCEEWGNGLIRNQSNGYAESPSKNGCNELPCVRFSSLLRTIHVPLLTFLKIKEFSRIYAPCTCPDRPIYVVLWRSDCGPQLLAPSLSSNLNVCTDQYHSLLIVWWKYGIHQWKQCTVGHPSSLWIVSQPSSSDHLLRGVCTCS